ncbi:translin-like [Actinia tenebrosa]|uniref:Translin n=1 Tax=Actinia tenebrosa TaxID=6105 RepID=A0A6P8HJC9_ACTTE|nr:translin-like [Actinia tenebrosa]
MADGVSQSYNEGVSSMFSEIQGYFSGDQEIREEIRVAVRSLEQTAREVLAVMQGAHQNPSTEALAKICTRSREKLKDVKMQYAELEKKIPKGQYYRYCDHWRFVNQRLTFLAAFIIYLEQEKLITREELTTMLGVQHNQDQGFFIDLDDYLMGILQLAEELSRLAVNSVTAKDYNKPLRIAHFLSELDAGFRLLNLKNDSLRKRFDGLKYDLKKAEEVVYDLSIRGLKPAEDVVTKTED